MPTKYSCPHCGEPVILPRPVKAKVKVDGDDARGRYSATVKANRAACAAMGLDYDEWTSAADGIDWRAVHGRLRGVRWEPVIGRDSRMYTPRGAWKGHIADGCPFPGKCCRQEA